MPMTGRRQVSASNARRAFIQRLCSITARETDGSPAVSSVFRQLSRSEHRRTNLPFLVAEQNQCVGSSASTSSSNERKENTVNLCLVPIDSPVRPELEQPLSQNDYVKKILTARVYDVAVETSLDSARNLSARVGNSVLLTREDSQPVISFKLRGAYNKMVHMPLEVLARGVITASAGNHAQGVAYAAARLNVAATIVVP